MTAARDVLAEVAARYGATVAPDAVVQRVPRGVSGRPLPVWRGNQLIYPDWKEQEAARRKAAVQRARETARRNRAEDAKLTADLGALHAAGARVPAMAQSLGVPEVQVRQMLRQMGLAVPRPTGPMEVTVQRLALIRDLAARGAGEAEISGATGLKPGRFLRQQIREAVPGFRFERKPILVLADQRRDRAEMVRRRQEAVADRIRALVASGATEGELSDALKIRNRRHLRRVVRQVVPDHVFPTRVAGGEEIAERDEAVRTLIGALSYEGVAARLGLTVAQVRGSFKRLRAAGRLPAGRLGRRPARKGIKLGVRAATAERRARMAELAAKGVPIDEIAAAVGRSIDGVRKALREAGVSAETTGKQEGRSRREAVRELHAQGLPATEIAARLRVHPNTVYSHASRMGLSFAASGAKGRAE